MGSFDTVGLHGYAKYRFKVILSSVQTVLDYLIANLALLWNRY